MKMISIAIVGATIAAFGWAAAKEVVPAEPPTVTNHLYGRYQTPWQVIAPSAGGRADFGH